MVVLSFLREQNQKKGTVDMASRPAVHLHVAGERFDTGSGGIHDHIDPSTGQVDASIPLAGPGEVDRAVNGADAAFRDWRRTPPEERRRLLLRLTSSRPTPKSSAGAARWTTGRPHPSSEA